MKSSSQERGDGEKASKILDFLSLGAGVQSTALLTLCCERDPELGQWIEQNGYTWPSYAVFADTGNEPDSVYRHLEVLQRYADERDFPVYITQYDDIVTRTLLRVEPDCPAKRIPSIPWFTKTIKGHTFSKGQNRRGCTTTYKVEQIHRCVLEQLGFRRGERKKHLGVLFRSWIGISVDEAVRMKDSMYGFAENVYPLIFAKGWNRRDCEKQLAEVFPHPVPKSACIICPFRNDTEWQRMKTEDPKSFQIACDFDVKTRNYPGFANELYLHSSMQPLDSVVFDVDAENGQLELFDMECEGMCGV